MTDEVDPQHLPVDDLAKRCAQETELFFQHQPHDPRYCFELFQRAFEGRDQAWDCIYLQYQPQVAGWVRKHPGFDASGEEVQYFIIGSFSKFWKAMMPERFRNFADLGSLLRYLQICVHSVMTDFNRSREIADSFDPQKIPEPKSKSERRKTESDVLDEIRWQKCEEWVNARLHGEKERLVLKLYIDDGLKPREIYGLFPDKFQDVAEVYRIRQNVVSRLGRDPEFDQFCGEND